jgi:hypothetical protein
MITEQDRYFGSAIVEILKSFPQGVKMSRLDKSPGGAAFTIGEDCLVYLKYSTARLTPWTFTFNTSHMDFLNAQASKRRTVIGFVCGVDGIAGVSVNEIFSLIPVYTDKPTGLSISRRPGHNYHLKSGGKELEITVSNADFVRKVHGQSKAALSLNRGAWPMPPRGKIV